MDNDSRQMLIRLLREGEREFSDQVEKLTKALRAATGRLESIQSALAALAPFPAARAVVESVEREADEPVRRPAGPPRPRPMSLRGMIRAILRDAGPLTTGDIVTLLPDEWRKTPGAVSSALCGMRDKGDIEAEATAHGESTRNTWRMAVTNGAGLGQA